MDTKLLLQRVSTSCLWESLDYYEAMLTSGNYHGFGLGYVENEIELIKNELNER
jgi:hypothetical protein